MGGEAPVVSLGETTFSDSRIEDSDAGNLLLFGQHRLV